MRSVNLSQKWNVITGNNVVILFLALTICNETHKLVHRFAFLILLCQSLPVSAQIIQTYQTRGKSNGSQRVLRNGHGHSQKETPPCTGLLIRRDF